jgi:hypothetical protein
MKLMKNFADYCTPARLYLAISIVSVIIVVIQNLLNPNSNELCIGSQKCPMSNKALMLALKIAYVIFWTWFLNFLCKKGLKTLSWFIFLIPFLFAAVVVGMFMVSANSDKKVVLIK